jgi:hypothetical protein
VILAADAGAALLGGRTAAARRVFFFFEDGSWPVTNPDGQRLFKQAVFWAAGKPLPSVSADFDHDLDVDQDDFGHLQACLTGNGVIITDLSCINADLNKDAFVTGADIAIFMNCLSGANVPAQPGCAGN